MNNLFLYIRCCVIISSICNYSTLSTYRKHMRKMVGKVCTSDIYEQLYKGKIQYSDTWYAIWRPLSKDLYWLQSYHTWYASTDEPFVLRDGDIQWGECCELVYDATPPFIGWITRRYLMLKGHVFFNG